MDDRRMSFVAHLTEVRKRMLWSVFVLLVGMGVAWQYADTLLAFVERPLTGDPYLVAVKAQIYEAIQRRFPAVYERYMPAEHPVRARPEDRKLNYTAPLEPFFVQIKISLLAGAVLARPVLLYHLWCVIAPGLTGKERRLVAPFITADTVSFAEVAGQIWLEAALAGDHHLIQIRPPDACDHLEIQERTHSSGNSAHAQPAGARSVSR
jgi:sec-independent protein translocase protein TatC